MFAAASSKVPYYVAGGLLAAKKLVDAVGGIDQAREAVNALEKLA